MFRTVMLVEVIALTLIAIVQASTGSFSHDHHTRRSLSGQATYYEGSSRSGACSFSTYTLPNGLYGTALSSSNWDGSANCGGCVEVTGPRGNKITAMIVDECPGCGTNHLDLLPDAFAALANPSTGVIPVNWRYVPCQAVSGPLQIHLNSGVSQYWFSAQVVNAKRRTRSMEVSTDGGKTWKNTQRQSYNYFQLSPGTGTQSAWIRVTSMHGTVVMVKNVPMTGDAIVAANTNYE